MFDVLWSSIGERVTDLVFRVEQLNEDFISHTLNETSAKHEAYETKQEHVSEMQQQQEEAIANSGSGGDKKQMKSLRNTGSKVKRNDPCTCGSGKKYKSCCMRK